MTNRWIVYLTSFFLLSLILAACVVQRSPVTGDKRAYGYSWEKEKQIGQQADRQIQQQYGIYQDEDLLSYVKNIGQDILSVSHMRREDTPEKYKETEFTFRVLDSPVVNAFALPGGYVYVTRGLVSHLENEAQLAVVLGHEIAHVAARHASQRAFEQQLGQVALLGGAIAGQELLGIPGAGILNIGGQATQLLFLKYSREDEQESDQLGVEYAAMQNYVAAEGAGFFRTLQRMSAKSGQSLPEWQSTHPDPSGRAERIVNLAEEWKQKGYEQSIIDREQYVNHLDNIIYGPNPREGFAREGVFYHPELAFQFPFPDKWQVINQRSLVAVVNKEQDAVSIMKLDGKSDTPEASVNEFLNQEGITTVEKSAASRDDLPAYYGIATGTTEKGTEIKFYVYALKYNDTIYRFINYTTLDQFPTYKPVFTDITAGFKQLNDQQILDIQPIRLQTFQTDRTDTFRSFIPDGYGDYPFEITPQELAILNQVELDQQIEKGAWIKVPRR